MSQGIIPKCKVFKVAESYRKLFDEWYDRKFSDKRGQLFTMEEKDLKELMSLSFSMCIEIILKRIETLEEEWCKV